MCTCTEIAIKRTMVAIQLQWLLVVRVRGDILTSSRRVGFSIVNLFSTGAKR